MHNLKHLKLSIQTLWDVQLVLDILQQIAQDGEIIASSTSIPQITIHACSVIDWMGFDGQVDWFVQRCNDLDRWITSSSPMSIRLRSAFNIHMNIEMRYDYSGIADSDLRVDRDTAENFVLGKCLPRISEAGLVELVDPEAMGRRRCDPFEGDNLRFR
jgi:hypothetical protein